jgi:hypothetical protein
LKAFLAISSNPILDSNQCPHIPDARNVRTAIKKELARQEIHYTDFPLPEGITLYLDGGVLLLPSEY